MREWLGERFEVAGVWEALAWISSMSGKIVFSSPEAGKGHEGMRKLSLNSGKIVFFHP